MTLVLETGLGVRGANSYVTPAYVTSYLDSRGRGSENNWSTLAAAAQQAACISATQYIDTRWGGQFKATRQFRFLGQPAMAILGFSANPTVSDGFTISSSSFTFAAAESPIPNSLRIIIGADLDATIENAMAAIRTIGLQVTRIPGEDELLLTNPLDGTAGNDTPFSVTGSNLSVEEAFQGGEDAGSQTLEFPRHGLVDNSGNLVTGIPRNLQEACAEYAIRSVAAVLFQDPTVDARGRPVVRVKEAVGPIETETEYAQGGAISQMIKPYPAADRLLSGYLKPRGVIR